MKAAKKAPTRLDLEREIQRMDPKLSAEDDAFKAALVLLAALSVEHTVDALTAFTLLPPRFVEDVVTRAREQGIFTPDGQVACEWFETDGGIAFWCDVNVVLGLMARARAR